MGDGSLRGPSQPSPFSQPPQPLSFLPDPLSFFLVFAGIKMKISKSRKAPTWALHTGVLDGARPGRGRGARVGATRRFRRFRAVAPGPFPVVLPRPPPAESRATAPRGRILTCQTRPRRVYSSRSGSTSRCFSRAAPGPRTRSPRGRPRAPGTPHTPSRSRPRARTHTAFRRSRSFPCAHTRTGAHTRAPRALAGALPRVPLTLQGRGHRRGEREDPRRPHG